MADLFIPDISSLLDAHLIQQRDTNGKREITGHCTWRASRLGFCLRQQFLELHLQQPPITQPDALSLRRFEIGHTWARQFKEWFSAMGILRKNEIEMSDPDLDVGAHGDFIIGNEDWQCGVELKSVQSKWFWYRTKEAENTASPENMMQTACYDILYRRQSHGQSDVPWIVLTASKDDLTLHQDVVTQEHRDEALRRLTLLNEAKRTNTPPPCTCTNPKGEFNGNGWKFCDYYTGNPDGECCVVTP